MSTIETFKMFTKAIIQNSENPILSFRVFSILLMYNDWVKTRPLQEQWYFDMILDININRAHTEYTNKSILAPDGKIYSKSEINYLAICN